MGGIVFCFVGGGSEWRKIKERLESRSNEEPGRRFEGSIVCLPYQPLNELSASLSAADLHVVVMGDPFVGIVHPCKIYNVLSVAAPVLCIGPERSHLVEIAQDWDRAYPWAQTRMGSGWNRRAHTGAQRSRAPEERKCLRRLRQI